MVKAGEKIKMWGLASKDGRSVNIGRSKDGGWLLLFRKMNGEIKTESRVALSDDAMQALVTLYSRHCKKESTNGK
jgi:hypothetical protein